MRARNLLLSTLLAAGCAGTEVTDTTSIKGPESPLPEDVKDDSFKKPTEHGALSFAVASQAEFTSDARYHAWGFTLTAKAAVSLAVTSGTPNMDTVMYVYRRTSSAASWGHYVKRNDDDGDSMLSRVAATLDSGEYRVLVKGYKASMRGTFAVLGTCEGAGCPASEGGDFLTALPAPTDLTAACADRIAGLLHSDFVSERSTEIVYERDVSSLQGVDRSGAELYRAYFEDVGYWADMAYDEGTHTLTVATRQLEDGALVSVDDGGDESTVTFVFDAAGQLAALYHSEQSPTANFYCGAAGGAALEPPSEFCVGAWFTYAPHDPDTAVEAGEGATTAGAASDDDSLAKVIQMAVAAYVAETGVAADATLTWSHIRWESGDWGHGGEVTIESNGAGSLVFEVGESEYESWVLRVTGDNGMRFVCTDG